MSTTRVDVLNIALMLGSCAAAYLLPFELFLFSYAVLGPLHYLTEISWLHSRGYFAAGRRDLAPPVALVGLCGLLLLIQFALLDWDLAVWAPLVNCVAIGVALAAVVGRNAHARVLVVGAALLLGLLMSGRQGPHDVLRIFLPTLIHVWVFTGAFILLGALRGRSRSGFLSLGVFAACSASFFVLRPGAAGGAVTPYVTTAYEAIAGVNVTLARWLGLPAVTTYDGVFQSATGVTVARFVAFAYTYHYLNWFSKTSVIQWHRIPVAWSVANVVLWLASVSLYAWDYSVGLTALFALSFLHVYLELPLNHRTFAGIGVELAALARGRRAPVRVR